MKVGKWEVLVEEPSMEAVLRLLLPRVLPASTAFQLYPFNGKHDLLAKLPSRLRGYRSWLPADWRILVLLDRDEQDCVELKRDLERIAQGAGFVTKTAAGESGWQVVTRIAVEELEAWFFGDVDALRRAYPRIPASLGDRAAYREPDAILGGTWEALERVLRAVGYFPTGYRKLEAARSIARHMDPARNRSRSFQVFRDTFLGGAQCTRDGPT